METAFYMSFIHPRFTSDLLLCFLPFPTTPSLISLILSMPHLEGHHPGSCFHQVIKFSLLMHKWSDPTVDLKNICSQQTKCDLGFFLISLHTCLLLTRFRVSCMCVRVPLSANCQLSVVFPFTSAVLPVLHAQGSRPRGCPAFASSVTSHLLVSHHRVVPVPVGCTRTYIHMPTVELW